VKSTKEKKGVVNQNKLIWIIGGVVFIILAAGAIYLGTKNTENKFGDILSKKPTPTIHIATKRPDSESHPPKQIETPPPRDPTVVEPSVVPDGDATGDTYLLPMSGSQKITTADLINFDNLDLKRARNEIYARHGRVFVSQDMACYFAKQSWYNKNPDYSEKLLSSLEISNAVFILNYEKEKQSPLINKDSGCVQN